MIVRIANAQTDSLVAFPLENFIVCECKEDARRVVRQRDPEVARLCWRFPVSKFGTDGYLCL